MKTTILPNTFIRVAVLFALAQLLTAGTRDDRRLAGVGNALPATIIVVTNINDSGPGSLRDALAIANDGDTVDATGVSGIILLTSGELQITHNVTINGPGAGNLAVNGNATFRVFENFASNVTISGFTITNGLPPTGDTNGGSGILNHGGLTLSYSSIVSNHTNFFSNGGGIGGGIRSDSGGTLTVMNSTISGNSASSGRESFGAGGGIFTDGATAISASTINDNTAVCTGGGLYLSSGTLTITNSTISGNSTENSDACPFGRGGGLYLGSGTLTITNSTISGNSAQQGGSIYNIAVAAQIGDTILNAGANGGTIAGGGTSLGYNVASDNGGGVLTGPGDQINTDPLLGPLQDNGGPTFTHALLPGSPAIDTGDPNFAPPPFYDQRGPGFPRVVNGRIDKGSFEVQSEATPTPTVTSTPTTTPTPRATPTPRPRRTPAPRL